jgi:hemolysin activation/secretion protein
MPYFRDASSAVTIAGAVLMVVIWPAPVGAQVPLATTPAAPPFEAVFLTGGSKLPPSRLTDLVAPLIGQPADAALLAKVRQAVAAALDAAGMGLVSIDAPVLQGGVALVRVTSLRIGRVDPRIAAAANAEGLPGEPVPAPGLLAAVSAALPALKAGDTPDLDAVDRQLRLANLQPHRRWSVDFRPTDDKPNPTLLGSRAAARQGEQIDARVVASGDSPFYGRVMFDNAGQAATGRERLRVQLGHGDLFGPGRSLDATVLVSASHPEKQNQLALRYQHPLPDVSTLLAVEVSRAQSRPGIVSQFFDVSGNSRSLNLSARHLMARRGALEPYAEIALESSVHDDVVDFFGTNLGSKVGVAPIALSLGGTWQGAPWNVFGQLRLRHNFGWGPDASDASYAGARFGATPDWTTLDAAAEARRNMGGGQEFVARTQMQWSNDALVSPQQFRAGGQTLLRGLPESELGGDKGIAVALEYWWAVAPEHRVGLLLDAAEVLRNKRLANEPESAGAATVGLGWNWQLRPGVRLSAIAANVVAASNLPQSKKGDSRLHLLLDWSF